MAASKVLRFKALDGQDVEFKIPKGVNPYLARRAIERAHQGDDAALVDYGLLRSEVEFVAKVVATLEAHRGAAA
jgi:hypothetical protein